METWVIFALLAPALFGIVNLLDFKVRNKYIHDEKIMAMFMGLFHVALLFVIPFVGYNVIELPLLLLSLFIGFIYVISFIFYLKALSKSDVSDVIIILNMTYVLVPLLAKIFVFEMLSLVQYLGFFVILVGGTIISTKKFKIAKGAPYAVLFGVVVSLFFVAEKYVYSQVRFWDGLSSFAMGSVFAGICLFLYNWKYNENLKTMKWKKVRLIFLAEIFAATAVITSAYAISLGPVSLVAALSNFQALFVLIYVILFSKFFPRLYSGQMDRDGLFRKAIAIVLLLIGLYFVQ